MKSVLSTKILSPSQRELLLNAGVQFAEYNAIAIKPLPFTLPEDETDFYIVTSQNAVAPLAEKTTKDKRVFCVGSKTKLALESHGFNVLYSANSAKNLGEYLVNNYATHSFTLVVGKQRREELPNI